MMVLVYHLRKCQLQTLIINYKNVHQCSTKPLICTYRIKRNSLTTDSTVFTTSFLKNNCGLSGKSLIRASKSLNLEPSDEKPHSVLKLLRTFGFPHPSITRIISTEPRILQLCSQKNLKRKLDFLLSISLSQTEVVALVAKNPRILSRSLDNQFNMIKSVTGCNPSAVSVIKCCPFVLTLNNPKSFLPNIEFLLALDVPHSQILKLLKSFGQVLGKPHDKLRKAVLKLQDMGFDLSSSYFHNALQTLTFINDSTWESRCDLLRSFGFSHHEIISMFKKQPLIMCFAEKTINERMEFFVNKLQWSPSRLSTNPAVLAYSFEKRTIPRCSVLQALVSKTSTSKSFMLSTILAMTERKFLEDYVNTYKDEVPELVEAYQGNLKFDEYTFKQKGKLSLQLDIHLAPVLSSN